MANRIVYHKPTSSLAVIRSPDREYAMQDTRLADNRCDASARWRRLRAWFLSHNPLCDRCSAAGLTVAAEHVHHILERKARPDLALDSDNLQALCQPCHNAVRHINAQS